MNVSDIHAGQVGSLSESDPIRISGVISALSYALDLTEGQPMGHSVRSCVLGMRIAQHIGMPREQRADLYYALLMKDAGCSSNAPRMFQILGTDDIKAKRDVKTPDWTKVGWDSLEYALSHARSGAPHLERVRALVEGDSSETRRSGSGADPLRTGCFDCAARGTERSHMADDSLVVVAR